MDAGVEGEKTNASTNMRRLVWLLIDVGVEVIVDEGIDDSGPFDHLDLSVASHVSVSFAMAGTVGRMGDRKILGLWCLRTKSASLLPLSSTSRLAVCFRCRC